MQRSGTTAMVAGAMVDSTMREDVEHKTMAARQQPTACLPRKLVMVFEQRSDAELIAMRVHELCSHRECHDRSRRVQVACRRDGRRRLHWARRTKERSSER